MVAEFLANDAAPAALVRDADPPLNPFGATVRAPDPAGAYPPWL